MSIMLPPDSDKNAGWRAYDLTPDIIAPHLERFSWYHEVGEPDACWIWAGSCFKTTGYGYLAQSSRIRTGTNILAHRFAWVAATGRSLTDDLTIDHLCVNRLCVNARHLEPVSLSVNATRRNTRRSEDNPYPRFTDDEIAEARARAAARVAILRREKVARDRATYAAYRSEKVACDSCSRTLRRDNLAAHLKRKCRPAGRPRKASA